MERRYQRATPAAPPLRESEPQPKRTAARPEPANDQALLIGAAFAWLVVAASSGLLLAQATRLRREVTR